jgi:hypothetical protein
MTLVVARISNGLLSIAADTLLSKQGMPLPLQDWILKSICLPGPICVSFSGSPELASKSFSEFSKLHPSGASRGETIAFFEKSSASTNNDYIIAFAMRPELVSIKNGKRTAGLSKTHWIGDKEAYECFRHYEHGKLHYEHGRALPTMFFADELTGSPANDLYSNMRNVVLDRAAPSVGGFVTVISNREGGFRFAVYSDALVDWPDVLNGQEKLKLDNVSITLSASGDNKRVSISQISPGYININAVAFYVLKGHVLVCFGETDDSQTKCVALSNIEPRDVPQTLDAVFRMDFRALSFVVSSSDDFGVPIDSDPKSGPSFLFMPELNTMP